MYVCVYTCVCTCVCRDVCVCIYIVHIDVIPLYLGFPLFFLDNLKKILTDDSNVRGSLYKIKISS